MTVLDNVMVGRHCRTAQRLPRQRAAPAACRGARSALTPSARASWCTSLGLDAVAGSAGRDLPFGTQKRVELARALAERPEAAAARRAGQRPEPRGSRRARRADPRHPRPPALDGAAGRAPHEPGDEHLGPRGGAELRQEDRRRHAGRGAAAPGGDRRPTWVHDVMTALLEVQRPARRLRADARAARHQLRDGRRASITTLLGANGAGKTTTLRALCAHGARRRAKSASAARASTAWPPRTSCAWASRTCPTAAAPSST